MSAIDSNSEVVTKTQLEDAIKDYHASILPFLGARPLITGGDTPIGAIEFFDDVDAPDNWVKADGSVLNIADYPFLASHYEQVHGSKNFYGGNGTTTFAVPDLQGEFLRGTGTNSHTNQGSGGAVGEHQDGTEHTFLRNQNTGAMIYSSYGNQETPNNLDTKIITNGKVRGISKTGGDVSTGDPLYYTSRPTNTSFLICIKAVPAGMIFSEDEQYYGKWIDGSDVWVKTVLGKTATSITDGQESTGTTAHNISNINQVLSCEIMNGSYFTVWGTIPYYLNASADNTNIYIKCNRTNIANTDFYVTLYYTKTS